MNTKTDQVNEGNSVMVGDRASSLSPTQEQTPLCTVHADLDRADKLELHYGNGCVACSLNERRELLDVLASALPPPDSDAVTFLRGVVERARASQDKPSIRVCLGDLMLCYERRIRSLCTPEQLERQPWRVSEYVAAEEALDLESVTMIEGDGSAG